MSHGFTTEQISFIKQLMTNRNKEVRHEVSDHLDNTLPLKKLEGGTYGQSIAVSSAGDKSWVSDGAYSPVIIAEAGGIINASTVVGSDYHLGMQAGYVVGIGSNFGQFHRAMLKSADHAIAGRTAQLRLAVGLIVNNVGPAVDVAVSLHQITGLGGAAGSVTLTASTIRLGAVTFTTPAAVTAPQQESSWTAFDSTNFPDGQYYFRVSVSGTTNASSTVGVMAQLQKRYV